MTEYHRCGSSCEVGLGACRVGGAAVVGTSCRARPCRKITSLAPRGEGLGSEPAVGGGGDRVAAGGEGVGDGGVGGEEAPGRARRAEALHLPLAQPDRDVRALRPVVLALALDVLGAELEFSGCRTVGAQPVGHQFLRRHPLCLQQLAHQPQGRGLVASALDEHIEDLALAVDRPPQVHGPTGDLHEHLVQMPAAAWSATTAPQPPGDQRPEAGDPDADRLVRDADAPLGQELLDVAQAEGEAQVEPDRVLDDGRREAEAAVEGRLHALPLSPGDGSGKADLTEPSGRCCAAGWDPSADRPSWCDGAIATVFGFSP